MSIDKSKLTLLERIRNYFGYRTCEICGQIVKDVEVPIHPQGMGWVHGIHVVTSVKGRKLIKDHAEMWKKLNEN